MQLGSLGLSARIRDIDAAIARRPLAYLIVSIGIVALVGFASYALGQAEITVVLSLLTLYAALRFQDRRVYLLVLAAHVAAAFLVMRALNSVPLFALAAATASVLLYAELSYRSVRSRERIDAERQRHLLNLDLLEQVRTSIARELDEVVIARLAVEAINRVIGYPRVTIYAVEGDSLVMMHQVGWPSPWLRIPRDTGILARAIREGAAQFVPDTLKDGDFIGPQPANGSEIAAPIYDGGTVIAGINVENPDDSGRPRLTADDVALVVSVAQEIGIAMSRARLHESAQRERDQFEQVTRALGQALCVYDRDGIPVYINRAFERLLGWTLPELQEKSLAGLVGVDQIARLRAGFEGWRAGVFGSSEMTLAHRDGRQIPFMVTTSPRSLAGSFEGGVGVLTDLREIKRAQQALEASERRFRALYLESERQRRVLEARDHLSTALALALDPEAISKAAIEAIATSLGYSQVTLYGLEGDWLVMQHQRGWTQVWPRIHVSRGVLGRAIRTRQAQFVPQIADDPDYINPLPGGRSAIAAPMFDRGEPIGAVFVETTDQDDPPELGPLDASLMGAVAEQIGIALGRARLYAEMERDRDLNAQVMAALGQGLILFDATARAEYMNRAFQELSGWCLDEGGPVAFSALVAEPDTRPIESALETALGGTRLALEVNVKHKDGTLIPVLVSLSPRSLDSAIGGCVAVVTDLRQIRETKRALQQSEARYRQLYQDAERRRRELEALDSVRNAILGSASLEAVLEIVADFIHVELRYASVVIGRLDADELVLLCARGWADPPARMPLTTVSRLAVARKTPIIARDAPFEHMAPLSRNTRSQICVPLMDGDAVFGTLSVLEDPAQALGDDDLRILTLIGQNLSLAIARAKLISDLEAARDQALHASRAKSEFLTMMSHELRTPLNVILGGTELLRTTVRRTDQIELARMTTEAGENLLDIINDVLDLARIEAGKVELTLEDTPIEPIARAVFRLLDAQAAAKGIQMVDHTTGSLLMARCDPKRARQVLLNLMANAIKFTQAGSIELHAAREGGFIRVTVTDTGPGITPENIDRLFRPFSQVDSSSSRRYGGTGLGLAISRQLVELMNGDIGVRSKPGEGSAFWFTLPATDSANRIIPESS
jgi:PAS domain S-box-containing protein